MKCLLIVGLLSVAAIRSQAADTKLFERLEYRAIGPANMGGRATDVEGVAGNPAIVYAATGSSGLWKTLNGGISWKPLFERERTYSIGDIALESGNPDVVWLGSGESNVRNSVSFGDGVYKSSDGGKTWKHMGLRETERISRMLVHPTDPNTVLAGALGHAFGPNEHRGVYLTNDAGKTWQKTLYIDQSHGVSDMDIDPKNPNIVFAAMWKFERKPWTMTSGSELGGIFRSTDGGRTWNKVTKGLPKLMGRIGVKVAPSKPNVVYVIAESNDGILFRSDDHGETFTTVSKNREIVGRGFYYSDLRIDPTEENRVYTLSTAMHRSEDGGKNFKTFGNTLHADHHALWIDPTNPHRIWNGNDGGIAVSNDRGDTWEYLNHMPMAQFYQIHADMRKPFYYVMGGLQDNGSWTGPSRNKDGLGILNDDWRMVLFGDGFFVLNDADDPDVYLAESQGGRVVRNEYRTGNAQGTIPQIASATGAQQKDRKYRFNWNSPLVISPHNAKTVYLGSNVLWRSQDFGKTWKPISPDLTLNDPSKMVDPGGPLWKDTSSAENYATVILVSESPARPGTIYTGSDDGQVQVTVNGGESWRNLTKNFTGVPPNSPVSHVEALRDSPNSLIVAFDRHMFDDFRPYIYKSTDGGKTWQAMSGNLPEHAYVHVVKQDPKNVNLIYVGTEVGLFASWDAGKTYRELGLKNLPHVPVHDLIVHPRENDLIVATHGRSVMIFDDATPLQQMTDDLAARPAHLFDIRPAMRFSPTMTRYGIGDKVFRGANPAYGALVSYYLKEKADEKAVLKLEVLDAKGAMIRKIDRFPKEAGVNRTNWNLRYDGPKRRTEPPAGEAEEAPAFGGPPAGPQVAPGVYTVRLTVGDQTFEKKVTVDLDSGIRTPSGDLDTQLRYGLELRDMQTAVNTGLRGLDSMREQLKSYEKLAKDQANKDGEKTISDALKTLTVEEKKLTRPADVPRLEAPPMLAENLGQLAATIGAGQSTPTQPMLDYYNDLKSEMKTKLPAWNAFVASFAASTNEGLRKAGLAALIAPKPVDIPK